MKKVKYVGDALTLLPTLNVEVAPGDVIDVPDDFNNANFEMVVAERKAASKEAAE